ncbi:MAG: exodeoxyribonuclease III [Candidatus Sumerlaeota bacterium]
MRIVSWNVNGLRAILRKNFMEFLDEDQPDILCLQEIKAKPEQVKLELDGYHVFWNSAQRPGYSGTATLSKVEPLDVRTGTEKNKIDEEGRVLTLEFEDYFLVNVYTPNSGNELKRLDFRYGNWDPKFLKYVRRLEKDKPVIFCGDLNVAHTEIDLANPDTNHMNAGFTDQEREGFDKIVAAGFIDTFREFYQDGGHYSWWSYRTRARERNVGWRIDYFCISPALRPRLEKAEILDQVLGSDHCPVAIEMK